MENLESLYQVARRAKNDNNSTLAADYYKMILAQDPCSWEAYFYAIYFKAISCRIADIRSAANSVSNCMNSVMTLIRDHTDSAAQNAAVQEIVVRSSAIARLFAEAASNHYYGIDIGIRSDYTGEHRENVSAAARVMYACGDAIDRVFAKSSFSGYAVSAWKAGVAIDSAYYSQSVNTYEKRIAKYDVAYRNMYNKKELEQKLKKLEESLVSIKKVQEQSAFNASVGSTLLFLVLGIGGFFAMIKLADGFFIGACFFIIGIVFTLAGIAGLNPSARAEMKRRAEAVDKRAAEINKEIAEVRNQLKKLG